MSIIIPKLSCTTEKRPTLNEALLKMYKKGQIKVSDVGRCLGRFSRPLYQSQNHHTVADVRYCREKTHLLNSVVVLLSEVMANWFQVWSREEFPPKTQLFVREHLSLRISRTGLSKYRQHNKTFLHLHFPRKKAAPTTVEETPIDSEDFVQRCRMSINIH